MKKLVMVPVMLFILSGCTSLETTDKTLDVISSVTNLRYYYENGDIVNFVGNADLNDEELAQVVMSLGRIDIAKGNLKKYEDDPQKILLDIQSITYEYATIKTAYLNIRDIVIANKSEYSKKEWGTFVEFDISAKVLDEQFNDLVDAAEANASLMTALKLANTTLKIASML